MANNPKEYTYTVKEVTFLLEIAKKEVTTLTSQLYNSYKRVKDLKEEVIYLKDMLTKREQELEDMSRKFLSSRSSTG
tara:strand:+ start:628 stop:858 length:231 start_codon:yes stop_codon:yes gene_type:complete